ncbi:MAG: YciI family protein [Burkholderiales bacterium]|nr:YciI family protein [Burkholderiales bacterium]
MIMMIPAVYRDDRKLDENFVPGPDKVQEMGRFNEELSKQVELLSLNGLHPLSKGARVSFSKGKTSVTDGPFVEVKEVLGGYWLVEADSKGQLVRLMQKCPAEGGDVIEIRQVFSAEDFAITQ